MSSIYHYYVLLKTLPLIKFWLNCAVCLKCYDKASEYLRSLWVFKVIVILKEELVGGVPTLESFSYDTNYTLLSLNVAISQSLFDDLCLLRFCWFLKKALTEHFCWCSPIKKGFKSGGIVSMTPKPNGRDRISHFTPYENIIFVQKFWLNCTPFTTVGASLICAFVIKLYFGFVMEWR